MAVVVAVLNHSPSLIIENSTPCVNHADGLWHSSRIVRVACVTRVNLREPLVHVNSVAHRGRMHQLPELI